MKKKLVALLCGALITGLVGCGSSQTDSGADGDSSKSGGDTLSILVASTTNTEALQNVYKGFEEETGIKTDVQVVPGATDQFMQIVQSKLATKDYPDIMIYFGSPTYISQIQPDKHARALDDTKWVEQVMDGIYDLGGSYEGKIYGLPISGVDFAGMFYNEDIFNELGVKVPTNYDELFDACQQIKDSGKDIVPIYEMGKQGGPLQAFSMTYLASYFHSEEGQTALKSLNEGTLKLEDSKILESYQKKMELQEAGFMNDKTDMMTGTWDTMFEALASGKTAMSFAYSNMLPSLYQSFPDANINMTALNGVASGTCTQFAYMMNSGNTEAQDAFADYLLQKDVLEKYYGEAKLLSPYKDINNELVKPIESMATFYREGNYTLNYSDALYVSSGTIIPLLQEMHVKTKTPEQFCETASQEYAKFLEESGQK